MLTILTFSVDIIITLTDHDRTLYVEIERGRHDQDRIASRLPDDAAH